MAGTNKPVRITVACAYGDVGHVFTPNGVVRDWLLGNQFAEYAEAETPARPAKFAARAAAKLSTAAQDLLKH